MCWLLSASMLLSSSSSCSSYLALSDLAIRSEWRMNHSIITKTRCLSLKLTKLHSLFCSRMNRCDTASTSTVRRLFGLALVCRRNGLFSHIYVRHFAWCTTFQRGHSNGQSPKWLATWMMATGRQNSRDPTIRISWSFCRNACDTDCLMKKKNTNK